MKIFVFLAACTTVAAQQKSNSWSEYCPSSPAQRCRVICQAPTCSDKNACAMRSDHCCQYTCHVQTPGKNDEDIYDCPVLDNIDSTHEAQYKAEYDMLDTNSDGAISLIENNKAVLKKWQTNYGMFCNDNAADTKKFGLWNQLGKLLQGKTKESGIGDVLNQMFHVAAQSINEAKGRRLQYNHGGDHFNHGPPSHHGPPFHHGPPSHHYHHWNHGRGGWGQVQNVDCSQKLSNRAAFDAAHVMHQFDLNGDRTISFCEYAQQRSKGAETVLVHG